MNFDFKANWNTLIKPLLHTKRIQNAIKKGTVAFLKSELKDIIFTSRMTEYERSLSCTNRAEYKKLLQERCNEYLQEHPYLLYDKTKQPIYFANTDRMLNIEEDFVITVESKLVDAGILKLDDNEPNEDKFPDDSDLENAYDTYYASDAYTKYCEYKQKVIEPYWNDYLDSNYEAYCLYGACHWYNPTFSYELAKMVAPNEVWKVKRGNIHTTVVNETGDKVFDILYYDEFDATKGGEKALADAMVLKN